jgi:uncharacterized protein involved in exopolysaccharide biosynthesis
MTRATEDLPAGAGKADGRDPLTVPADPAVSTVDGAVDPPGTRWRHRIRLAAAVAFLIVAGFAGAAVGYGRLQPTIYGAQADFVLTAQPALSDAAVDRAMVTQTMIVSSDPVLAPVATQTGVALPQLRGQVSAQIVGRSNILRLTVGDRDRARAVLLAQLITVQYLRAPASASAPAAPTPATSTAGGPTAAGPAATDQGPPIVATVLSAAAPLEQPLQPQPLRTLAAGIILGLLVAAGVVTLLLRQRPRARPAPHWE